MSIKEQHLTNLVKGIISGLFVGFLACILTMTLFENHFNNQNLNEQDQKITNYKNFMHTIGEAYNCADDSDCYYSKFYKANHIIDKYYDEE